MFHKIFFRLKFPRGQTPGIWMRAGWIFQFHSGACTVKIQLLRVLLNYRHPRHHLSAHPNPTTCEMYKLGAKWARFGFGVLQEHCLSGGQAKTLPWSLVRPSSVLVQFQQPNWWHYQTASWLECRVWQTTCTNYKRFILSLTIFLHQTFNLEKALFSSSKFE